MTFPERVRQARRHAKLSQEALALLIGVQRSAVSNWESKSRVKPSMANLSAVAKATGVAVEWLGTGRGPMHPKHDPLLDVPAVDAFWVEQPQERELLRLFRLLNRRSQSLGLELFAELAKRSGTGRKAAFD